MPISTIEETHAETIKLDSHELARRLVGHLGATIVAVLANVKDRKLPYRWMKEDGPEPRDSSLTRLQTAHRAWSLISLAENEHVARAWFIGTNPRLGEIQPMFALREGKHPEVLAAAQAFVDGTDE